MKSSDCNNIILNKNVRNCSLILKNFKEIKNNNNNSKSTCKTRVSKNFQQGYCFKNIYASKNAYVN